MLRVLRLLAIVLAVVVLLPVLAGLGLLAAVQVPAARGWAVDRIEDAAAAAGTPLTIDGLRVAWPLDVAADTVALLDEQGAWLRLRDVRLDWRPPALAGGRLHIERLTAAEAALLRKPAPGAAPEAEADGAPLPRPPRPPLALRLDAVEVARLTLDEAVLGQAVEGTASGEAALGDDGMTLSLMARRTDAVASQARLAVAWNRGADTLAVDAHLHSAAGGVAGALLARPDLPAVTLAVNGDGALDDWRGAVTAAVAGETCVEGSVGIAGTASARRLGADLTAQPDCLPAEWRQLAGAAPVRLRGAAVLEDGAAVRVEAVNLAAATLSAEASGRISGDAMDLTVTAHAPDLAPLAAVLDVPLRGDLGVEARLHGLRAAPTVAARLEAVEGGFGDDLAWRGSSARLEIVPHRGRWQFAAALEGTFGGGAVPPWLEGPQRLSLAGRVDSGGRAELASLALVAPMGRVAGSGVVDAVTGAVNLALTVDVADAAPLGLAGAATLGAQVRGDLMLSRFDVAFNGTGRALAVGVGEVDALLGPHPAFAGTAALTAAGALFDLRLDGAGGAAELGGRLAWDDARPLLGWRLRLPDLGAVAAGASGVLDGLGVLAGLDAEASAAGLAEGRAGAAGRGPYPLRGAFATPLADPVPQLAVQARVEGVDVAARGRVVPGAATRLADLVLESRGGRVSGEVTVLADGRLRGRLRGAAVPLAPWSDLAGADLGGRADVDLALAPRDGGQGATLAARVTAPEVSGFIAGAAEVDARLEDVFAAAQGSVRLRATDLDLGAAVVEAATLDLTGALATPAFALSADGRATRAFELVAEGRLGAEAAHVAALSGAYGGQPVRLLEPADVTWSAAGVRFDTVAVAVGDGRARLGGEIAADGIVLEGELIELPLDLLDLVVPGLGLQGRVDGDFDLGGRPEAPRGAARLTFSDLALVGDPLLSGMSAAASARWDGGRLRLKADLDAPDVGVARLTAALPLGPGLAVDADGPLSGRLVAEGPLGPVADALAPAGHVAAGQLAAEITVAGTPAAPVLDGTVRLAEGRYENIVAGTAVQGIEAVATAAGTRHFTIRATGRGPGGGRVEAEGTADIGPAGPRYDVRVELVELLVVQTSQAFARASGALALAGEGTTAALEGRVTVEKAEYDIAHAGGAGVVDLDVVEVNRPGGGNGAEEEAAPAGGGGRLEVGLSVDVAASRIVVRGRGLEAEMRGDLAVTGTLAAPNLVGRLRVVRGTYDLVGRSFRLRDGMIVFDGGRQIDPRLEIEAAAEGSGLTAIASVSGRASAPSVDFSSEPPYPSDEVLARLLFGREMGALTTAQQVQIGRALAALAGGGEGFDPIGRVRAALGLDVLEISPGGDGEAGGDDDSGPAVSAGRYLDSETFLRLEQGSEGGRVVVERRLGRGLSLETELGGETGGGVGLKWQRDY